MARSGRCRFYGYGGLHASPHCSHTHLVHVEVQGIVVVHAVPFELELVVQDIVDGVQHLALEFYLHYHRGLACPEGQARVTTVDATEGFAHKLHDAVDLGLDVSEADVGERVAVLVDVNGTCGEKGRVSVPLYLTESRVLLSPAPVL